MTIGKRLAEHRALAIGAAALVILAGGLGGYFILNHLGGGGVVTVDDGPTFYKALGSVNSSVADVMGGPWILSQVFGIATPVPSSPSVFGWPGSYPMTLSSCQAAFNGLTIWNGSIPLFDGTFNSGTAPFWQLVYFSNVSQQLLVGTDVLDVVHVFSPIAMSSACAMYSGLGVEPWVSSWTFDRWAFPANSPAMAASAWNAVGESFVTSLAKQPTEMYYMGDLNFGSGQPAGTQTKFFLCGTVGSAGVTQGLDVFTNVYDTADVTGWFNYTLGCTPTYDNFTAIPVEMKFFNSTVDNGATTMALRQAFQLLSIWNSTYSPSGSLGINSWMISLNLTSGSGHRVAVSGSGCSAWVPSLGYCAANSSGWYAVLISGNGGWQGSFGASPSGPGWDYPVIPLASNESLAVIVPSSWNVSGYSLDVTSTTTQLPLFGSTVFS
ncbi:MAG: hypothetical protein WA691_04830 [Thermoplasmata archaeon]